MFIYKIILILSLLNILLILGFNNSFAFILSIGFWLILKKSNLKLI